MARDLAKLSRLPLSQLCAGDVVNAAASLVGCILARRLISGHVIRAMIVETEAYHERERGCHAHKGRTPRTEVMFGEPGRLYVYFTYGMWHCMNVVCESRGTAAAVLLRAAMPLPPDDGSNGNEALRLSGPGLWCQGMQIDREQNGVNVLSKREDVWLYRPASYTPPPLAWTTRIGFSFKDTLNWRCYWNGHKAVSPGRPGVIVGRKKGK